MEVNISAKYLEDILAGAVVGYSEGIIIGCSAEGSIEIESNTGHSYAGEIVGHSVSLISECVNSIDIISRSANYTVGSGGIAGLLEEGIVPICFNNGVLNTYSDVYGSCAGGIVASNHRTIKNCLYLGIGIKSISACGVAKIMKEYL